MPEPFPFLNKISSLTWMALYTWTNGHTGYHSINSEPEFHQNSTAACPVSQEEAKFIIPVEAVTCAFSLMRRQPIFLQETGKQTLPGAHCSCSWCSAVSPERSESREEMLACVSWKQSCSAARHQGQGLPADHGREHNPVFAEGLCWKWDSLIQARIQADSGCIISIVLAPNGAEISVVDPSAPLTQQVRPLFFLFLLW